MFVAYNEKSFVPAFLRSLLITYLESGKRNYCFEKSLEKDLNFGSKNLYESCIDFCAIDVRVTVEFINLSYYWQ